MGKLLPPVSNFHAPIVAPAPEVEVFTWVSNGDTNDVLYFLGTNYGAISWVNPHTAGRAVVTRSSSISGVNSDIVNRAAEYNTTDNNAGEWIAIHIGAGDNSFVLSDYSLRNGNDGGGTLAIRNWKMQGSNNVATDDVTGVNAATWVDLDTRSSDTSMGPSQGDWIHKILGATPSGYEWIRLLNTGVNSAGLQYIQICEIQLYGTLYIPAT